MSQRSGETDTDSREHSSETKNVHLSFITSGLTKKKLWAKKSLTRTSHFRSLYWQLMWKIPDMFKNMTQCFFFLIFQITTKTTHIARKLDSCNYKAFCGQLSKKSTKLAVQIKKQFLVQLQGMQLPKWQWHLCVCLFVCIYVYNARAVAATSKFPTPHKTWQMKCWHRLKSKRNALANCMRIKTSPNDDCSSVCMWLFVVISKCYCCFLDRVECHHTISRYVCFNYKTIVHFILMTVFLAM